ncbi:hypothetical protein [Paenibacillus sp. Z3-2]
MSGSRWLYLSNDLKVHRVPKPKNSKFKPIKELAGQEVLKVHLYYETFEKKPSKLLLLQFDRVTLDSEGSYELTQEEMDKALYNFNEFGFVTPEELAQRDGPLSLPIAPVLPTIQEKNTLYNYLKENLNPLSHNAPYIMEERISALK